MEALVIHHTTLFEGLPHDFSSRSRASSAAQAPPWQPPPQIRDDEEEFPMRKPESNKMAHAASLSRGLFTGMKRRASSARMPKTNAASSPGGGGGASNDQRPTSPLSLTRQHSNHSQQSLSMPLQPQQAPQLAAASTAPPVVISQQATTCSSAPPQVPIHSETNNSSAAAIAEAFRSQQPSPSASIETDIQQLYAAYHGGTSPPTSVGASLTPTSHQPLPPGAASR